MSIVAAYKQGDRCALVSDAYALRNFDKNTSKNTVNFKISLLSGNTLFVAYLGDESVKWAIDGLDFWYQCGNGNFDFERKEYLEELARHFTAYRKKSIELDQPLFDEQGSQMYVMNDESITYFNFSFINGEYRFKDRMVLQEGVAYLNYAGTKIEKTLSADSNIVESLKESIKSIHSQQKVLEDFKNRFCTVYKEGDKWKISSPFKSVEETWFGHYGVFSK